MILLRRKLHTALFLALSICALLAVSSSASAATQVGQKCPVSGSQTTTLIQSAVSSGTSYTVPASGILTSWGVNTSLWGASSMLSAVFGTYSGGSWTITRMTPFEQTLPNLESQYAARLPVSAGEVLGMVSYNPNNLVCSGFDPTGDTIAASGVFPQPGDSFVPGTITSFRIAVWGVVEADVDNDGYGDETQDKCPQSAAFQIACPVLSISQLLASVKGAISVTGTANLNSSLTAAAVVKVPKLGKKKAATVSFSSPPTAFTAGQFTKLKLKLPSRVKNALAALKKSTKLKVTVTLSGNGIANTATSVKSISLPGTKKNKKKK